MCMTFQSLERPTGSDAFIGTDPIPHKRGGGFIIPRIVSRTLGIKNRAPCSRERILDPFG